MCEARLHDHLQRLWVEAEHQRRLLGEWRARHALVRLRGRVRGRGRGRGRGRVGGRGRGSRLLVARGADDLPRQIETTAAAHLERVLEAARVDIVVLDVVRGL